MNISEINQAIEAANIGRTLFIRLKEAEQYGAASSMQWLCSVLSRLKTLVESGKYAIFDTGDEIVTVQSVDALNAFLQKHFPDTFSLIK